MNTSFLEHVENEVGFREQAPQGKPVLVIYAGARRLAYRDHEGQWRDHFTGFTLDGPVKVIGF